MIDLQVNFIGLDELRGLVARFPAAAQTVLHEELTQSAEILRRSATSRIHTRTGKTRVTVKVLGAGENIRADIKTKGRGAFWGQRGRAPGKQPPIAVIEGWVRRAGIVRGSFDVATRQRTGTVRATKAVRSAETGVAFLIARAISRQGTKASAHPFMRPALEAERSGLLARWKTLPAKIIAAARG